MELVDMCGVGAEGVELVFSSFVASKADAVHGRQEYLEG